MERGSSCFCLSKASAESCSAISCSALASEPTQHAALRTELLALRPTLLAKRAREAGADEATVDAALDSADPKLELIELIVQLVPSADEEEQGDVEGDVEPVLLLGVDVEAHVGLRSLAGEALTVSISAGTQVFACGVS